MTDLLTVSDLRVTYGRRAKATEILHGVSLSLKAGETLGLVGESGSGKTTIGRAILGLVKPSAGEIRYRDHDIAHYSRSERHSVAQDLQVIFQDPYTSLNPALTVSDILCEPLVVQGKSRRDARAEVGALLDAVGLPSNSASRRPREFSGGQRQRVAIARALAVQPKLIVCDEPVSALDLSTQARVLDLLIEIQQRTGVAYLFVSHDLAVVRHISHRVAVLYRGDIVETGAASVVTSHPQHPYTQRLLNSAPVADPALQRKRREEWRRLMAQTTSTQTTGTQTTTNDNS